MIAFVSLNTICNDILYIARGGKVVSTEQLTLRQIEYWVHQYRALLLKQDLDKGKMPNPDYIQELNALELSIVDKVGSNSKIITNKQLYRTTLQLPKTIDLNHKSGIFKVGTLQGEDIQLIPEHRANYQVYHKYTNQDMVAYLNGGYIYVDARTPLRYIKIQGIFEIPSEINRLNNPNTYPEEYSMDYAYPIPYNMVSILKDMILRRELQMIMQAPSDSTNDEQSKVESNIEQNASARN